MSAPRLPRVATLVAIALMASACDARPPAPLGDDAVVSAEALQQYALQLEEYARQHPGADLSAQTASLRPHRIGRSFVARIAAAAATADLEAIRRGFSKFPGSAAYRAAASATLATIEADDLRAAFAARRRDATGSLSAATEEKFLEELEALLPAELREICAEHRAAFAASADVDVLRRDIQGVIDGESVPTVEAIAELRTRIRASSLPDEERRSFRGALRRVERAAKLVETLDASRGVPTVADWNRWAGERRAVQRVECIAAVDQAIANAKERAVAAIRAELPARAETRAIREADSVEVEIQIWRELLATFELGDDVGLKAAIETLERERDAASVHAEVTATTSVDTEAQLAQLRASADALIEPYRTNANEHLAGLTVAAAPPPPKWKHGERWTNELGMEFVFIAPGSFVMGSPESEADRNDDERQHEVQLRPGYWLATTEVTQGQWRAVMATEPWAGKENVQHGGNVAASYISWEDAQEFVAKLGERDGIPYRLPTEAEWEYACRAGSTTAYSFGDKPSQLGEYGWYKANAWDLLDKFAQFVGQKQPNAWGLHDMHGNVWEWCSDWYADYPDGPVIDPTGPEDGSVRVYRGGSWGHDAGVCRSASRQRLRPWFQTDFLGIRIATTTR